MSGQFQGEGGSVIRGEFFTDGASFVMRLADTPISGVGDTPAGAFEDLLRAQAAAGNLPAQLRALAEEQRSEQVRAAVVRTTMAAVIAFGVVGGALAGAAALAPGVIADIAHTTLDRLSAWVEGMPPETEQKIERLIHRFDDDSCAPAAPAPGAPGK